ncbi:MAG TPA: hypothetical protein VG204_19880 [Terriglobia bacterium]|nr:hypothetical protein [Terriglobia bacterium]
MLPTQELGQGHSQKKKRRLWIGVHTALENLRSPTVIALPDVEKAEIQRVVLLARGAGRSSRKITFCLGRLPGGSLDFAA